MTLRHVFRTRTNSGLSMCSQLWKSKPSSEQVPFTRNFTVFNRLFAPSKSKVNENVVIDSPNEGLSPEQEQPKKKRRKKKVKLGDESNQDKNFKDLSKYNSTARSIIEYIDENNDRKGLWESLTKHDLKQGKLVPWITYIAVESCAEKFALAIKKENPDILSPVLELHPGLGLLTEKLLNAVGFKFVTCMEDRFQLRKSLTERFNVNAIDLSMNGLPRQHHLDKMDGGERIHNFFSQIRYNKDDDQRRDLYIVGTLPNIGSINFLIRTLASRRVFFEDDSPFWSNVTLFVAFGTKVHLICTANPDDGLVAYRATTILFNTLFKYKEIAVLPRKAFVPWELHLGKESHKGPRRPKLNAKDPDNMHVYRIDVNEETIQKVGKENLFSYFYFVRHHLFARTNPVIPELEKWIPGCGVRLIRQGYDIFSQIGRLSPEQILDLYLNFVSWPEFKNSSFLNAVEKYQTRIELIEEEDDPRLVPANRDFHGSKT